ncbi:sugar phosphate isomerase/epimerase [Salinadaptatus halalkaliphilus]|uniref:Sugar phosphate isomerase/epimerase n=1 Tax=Salinadaptatus halalkaliphilus TaxID=2419781 RepID=A0A4S3TL42_9EURY|nr:sugar phosphate isomerase/epimerase [Salinadaptatus halalkaliphilus]THE63675.1 sugar phosphate isomerase/epimerase [Salinadaptatus halalkaliphilus]
MDIGLTVGDSLERTAETVDGFDLAEFSIGETTDPGDIDTERLEAILADADADCCVHLPFKQDVVTSVPEINDAICTYLARLLEWAGDIDARKAVLHGTARNPHDTALRPLFVEQLEALDEAAADNGIELVVENVGHQKRGFPLSVLGELASDAGTAICFDVGHAYMERGNDGIDSFCSQYGELISHLHVHDARSRGDTHIPIGAGEIDYGVLESHLAGFDGTVAIEVFTDDIALLRDTAERIRTVLDGDS